MTGALPLFAADDVRARYATDAVLASLPLSYAHADEPAAGGVAVIGGSGGWPEAAAQALQAGTAGVILIHPQPAELSPLRAAVAEHGVVVVDSVWAANPAVPSAASAFRSAATPGQRLECRVSLRTGSALRNGLLHQLSLVRALLGQPVQDLRILHDADHVYLAEARSGDTPVDLSVICTNAVPEQARLRLLTIDGSVDLKIPGGETAQPALLTVTSPQGASLAPTLYESGHRATWRRLHQLITSGDQPTDLDDLEQDMSTASALHDLDG